MAEQLPVFVYAVIAPTLAQIKIGVSVDPLERLKHLQTAHGATLELLATAPGGRSREKSLHHRLAPHRLHGEWFDASPEVLAVIEELKADTRPATVFVTRRREPRSDVISFRIDEDELAFIESKCRPGESLGEYARRRFLAGSKKAVKSR